MKTLYGPNHPFCTVARGSIDYLTLCLDTTLQFHTYHRALVSYMLNTNFPHFFFAELSNTLFISFCYLHGHRTDILGKILIKR